MEGLQVFADSGAEMFSTANSLFYISSTSDLTMGSNTPVSGMGAIAQDTGNGGPFTGSPYQGFAYGIEDYAWDSRREIFAFSPMTVPNEDWYLHAKVLRGNITRMIRAHSPNFPMTTLRIYKIRIGRPTNPNNPTFGLEVYDGNSNLIYNITDKVLKIAYLYNGPISAFVPYQLDPNRKYAIHYFGGYAWYNKAFNATANRFIYTCNPVGWHNGLVRVMSREYGRVMRAELALYFQTPGGQGTYDSYGSNDTNLAFMLFDVTDL